MQLRCGRSGAVESVDARYVRGEEEESWRAGGGEAGEGATVVGEGAFACCHCGCFDGGKVSWKIFGC